MSHAHATVTDSQIRQALFSSLRLQLELPAHVDPDVDAAFTDLGLDSAGVYAVTGDLERELGVLVPPETLFDFPTVRSLTEHLAAVCIGARS